MTDPVIYPIAPKPIEAYLDGLNGEVFPSNIISLLHARFDMLELGLNIVDRMPSTDDENYTIGLVTVARHPQANTDEIIGRNAFTGATIQEYVIAVYSFVKDAERERGMAAHSALAEIVEHILADDQPLRASLGMLEATVMGQKKRMQKFYIRNTRYLANDIGGVNMFMSATEVVFEIEKVR